MTESEMMRVVTLITETDAKIAAVARDILELRRDIEAIERAINGTLDGQIKGIRTLVRDNAFRIGECREADRTRKADKQWLWGVLIAALSLIVATIAIWR